jgi:hypothetical protein
MEIKNNFLGNLLFVAILIFMGYQWWSHHQERNASINWPSTEGKITKAYLKEIQHTNDRDDKGWIGRSTYTDYEVRINYEYEVDGRFYNGDRIEVTNPSYSTESKAMQALAEYKEGKKVTVYYNPKNPRHSVLHPG